MKDFPSFVLVRRLDVAGVVTEEGNRTTYMGGNASRLAKQVGDYLHERNGERL